jgi:hypothetical protein
MEPYEEDIHRLKIDRKEIHYPNQKWESNKCCQYCSRIREKECCNTKNSNKKDGFPLYMTHLESKLCEHIESYIDKSIEK